MNVTQDRATAVELGFTGRNELIAAVHTVRGIAREEATTYLMEDDQQAAATETSPPLARTSRSDRRSA